MDWLYITVMGYIVVSALRGYHKGFLRVIYSVVSLAAAVVFVAVAAPMLRDVLLESTNLAKQIETGSEKYVRRQIEKNLEDDSFTVNKGLLWATLPEKYQKQLDHAASAAIPELLESQGIYKKMAKTIAQICISVLAFFLSLIVILLILFIIGRKLDLFSKKPGIHLVNMIFGFFAGVLKAFLVIWVVFLMLEMTKILPVSTTLIGQIQENGVLRGLYDQNPLLKLI